jgi:hypothetical protein
MSKDREVHGGYNCLWSRVSQKIPVSDYKIAMLAGIADDLVY